jgi:hypothetical protein
MKTRLFLILACLGLFTFDVFSLSLSAGQPLASLWGCLGLSAFALAWLLALPLFPKD